jgi:lathosterol oxidase
MSLEGMLEYLKWFALFIPLLYVGYFLLPCGVFYYFFYVIRPRRLDNMKIVSQYPSRQEVWREVRWSSLTVVVFAALSALLLQMIRGGYTLVYFEWSEYPLWYHPASFLIAYVLHDIYLYWIHRFMHLKWVFPYSHLVHHRSQLPTPFGVLSFQPAEAVLQYAIFPILAVILPMHPVVLGVYFFYNLIANIGGHLGFELFLESYRKGPFAKYFSSSTSHQIHHLRFDKNLGGYTNVWDRLMGSHMEDVPKTWHRRKPALN